MYIVKEDSKFKFWTLLERTESSVLGRQLTVDGPNQMVKVTWQSKGDTGQQLQFLRYFFHQSRLKLKPIKIFTIWFSIVRSSDVVVVGSMKCLFNMKGGIHTIKSLWRWILWKTSNRVKIQIWWDSAQVQPLCFVRMFGLWWFWESCSSQRPAGGATKVNIYWNG